MQASSKNCCSKPLQENPSTEFAICMTFLAPGVSARSMPLSLSIPIARSPSIATLRRRYTSVGRPKCSDSPLPPGKSGPGSPCKNVSRWRLRYSALPSVTGQTGMYMTLESDEPMCTLSTAWIARRARISAGLVFDAGKDRGLLTVAVPYNKVARLDARNVYHRLL